MASNVRAVVLRPARRSDAATWPKARARRPHRTAVDRSRPRLVGGVPADRPAPSAWERRADQLTARRGSSSRSLAGPGSHRIDERVGEDHGARIEQSALVECGHSVGSMTRSMSARRAAGSTAGSRVHRRRSSSARRAGRGKGRSSAIGRPSRVTVRCSPAATRSSTSAPWFLSSRTVTSAMRVIVSRVRQARRDLRLYPAIPAVVCSI